MGHFYEDYVGRGKNRSEAQRNMEQEFYFENGHRCDIRDVTNPRLLRTEPPTKWVNTSTNPRMQYMEERPDPDAPKDQWIQVWLFHVHYHH